MGIRESLLNTITSVGNSDFVRIVTSAGASSKATVANLFKSFESGLGAKSSLTTSDYIRVVGSDNVSYKQSVNEVGKTLSSINSTLTALASGTNLITLDYGVYALNSNGYTNPPHTGSVIGRLVVRKSADDSHYRILDYRSYDGTQYIGSYTYAGAFAGWVKQPTRAEVDALNSNTNLYSQAKEIYGSGTINDADNVPVRSVYIAYTTAAHVPQQGILYTWGGNSYRAQLLVCGNCMYTRAKAGNGNWSSWYKYTGTAQ